MVSLVANLSHQSARMMRFRGAGAGILPSYGASARSTRPKTVSARGMNAQNGVAFK